MKDLTDKEIEDYAHIIILNYLTDNNPEGDFKHSTIGAEDNMAWWINGAKWYRDQLKSTNHE